MREHEEDMCKICESYENYLFLQEKGYEEEESFHEAVSYLMSELIEDLMNINFEEGFDEGYISALRSISRQTGNMADEIEEMECTCDEDCSIDEEVLQCGVDCDCYDDECVFEDDLKIEDEPKEFLYGEEFAQWLKDRM